MARSEGERRLKRHEGVLLRSSHTALVFVVVVIFCLKIKSELRQLFHSGVCRVVFKCTNVSVFGSQDNVNHDSFCVFSSKIRRCCAHR